MVKFISFDMDGHWSTRCSRIGYGPRDPTLYAQKMGFLRVGQNLCGRRISQSGRHAIEWYDIKYWFRLFRLEESWNALMERYIDKIAVYPDVDHLLDRLSDHFQLVLTSNAGREFIKMKWGRQGLENILAAFFQPPLILVK